jgi:hypothetical protein
MDLGAYDAARVAMKLQIPPVAELSRNNNLFDSFIFQLPFSRISSTRTSVHTPDRQEEILNRDSTTKLD